MGVQDLTAFKDGHCFKAEEDLVIHLTVLQRSNNIIGQLMERRV
jgi:hypothetical protein